MGATAIAIGVAAASGIWKAKTEYDQNKAAARQAQANADIAYQNAQIKDDQAHEQGKNNALNQEVKHRQMAAQLSQQQNQVGASGLTMSGSNMRVLEDNQYNMAFDMGIDAYNGRQKIDDLFQQSTNYLNQGDIYKDQAKQYKKAARMSLIKNALETGASIALAGAGGAGSASKTAQAGTKTAAGTLKNNIWIGNIPRSKAVALGYIPK